MALVLSAALCGSWARAAAVSVCEDEAKLRQAIAAGGEITFSCDSTNVITGTLIIDRPVILDGIGHTVVLDGQGSIPLFRVTANGDLTLRNLTLRRGKSANGGAVLNNGMFTASNCVFAGNIAVGVDGANGIDATTEDDDVVGDEGTDGASGTAAYGGAIFNANTAYFTRCSFVTNRVTGGKGGKGGKGGDGSWQGGNGGDSGNGGEATGGAIFSSGTLVLTECTFSQNRAIGNHAGEPGASGSGPMGGLQGNGGAGGMGAGGAVYSSGYCQTRGCTFSDNTVRAGNSTAAGTPGNRNIGYDGKPGGSGYGGGFCNFGNLNIVNSTFSTNRVTGGGGGNGGPGDWGGGDGGAGGDAWGGSIYNNGSAHVTHCTIRAGAAYGGTNGAAGTGFEAGSNGRAGASRGGNLGNTGSEFWLKNSIVAGVTNGFNADGTFTDLGYNLSSDASLHLSATGSQNSVNPKIGPLSDNGGPTKTFALQATSPAIDKIPVNVSLESDQRGVERPAHARSDIGAYEYGAPPRITSLSPHSVTLNNGDDVTFTVTAVGDPTLRYQWRFKGQPLTGTNTTSPTFTIEGVTASNEGQYDVMVTNKNGATISDSIEVSIIAPPVIVRQPTNQIVALNSNVTLSVEVAGQPEPTYQWQYGVTNSIIPPVVNFQDIMGATAATYEITGAQSIHGGPYRVLVSNTNGSVTSAVAVLTVTGLPTITQQPTNQTVAQGSLVIFTTRAESTTSLTYQWQRNGTNIAGATGPSLQLANVTASQEGQYTCRVSNGGGWVVTDPAMLKIISLVIVRPLTNQTVLLSNKATFVIVATNIGSSPLSYKWYHNAAPISEETASSYVIDSVKTNHAGTYSVVISNQVGKVTNSATLTVDVPKPVITEQPISLSVGRGANGSFTVAASGHRPLSYFWHATNSPVIFGTNQSLPFVNVQTTNAGRYYVVVSNFYGMATSSVATLSVTGMPPTIVTQPAHQTVALRSEVRLSVGAVGSDPLTYQWRLNDVNLPGAASNVFFLAEATAQHMGNYRVVVSNPWGSVTSTVATLKVTLPPTITSHPVSQIVTQGSQVTFRVMATGTDPITYQWRFGNSNLLGGGLNSYTIGNVKTNHAGAYEVMISNVAGTETSESAELTVFSVIPSKLSVAPGETATFEVQAIGGAPFRYQWNFQGTNLPGATNAVLTIPQAQARHAGSYEIVVFNRAGAQGRQTVGLNVSDSQVTLDVTQIRFASNQVFSVTFTGRTGANYTLEYKNSLNDSAWTSLSPTVSGTNGPITLTDTLANPATPAFRFYRVRVE